MLNRLRLIERAVVAKNNLVVKSANHALDVHLENRVHGLDVTCFGAGDDDGGELHSSLI